MSLIHLYDPLEGPDAFERFVDYNFVDHLAVIDALQTQKSITIGMLDIRVATEDSMGLWALNHQQLHDQINAALGFSSSDFTHIDLHDQSQLESMKQLHAVEHRQWHDALNL